MFGLSRKFRRNRSTLQFKKCFHDERDVQPSQPFIPFSQLQKRKLLESQLVSVLHGCNNVNHVKQVHAHLYRQSLDQCCYVLTKLIRTLTKLGVPMDPYPRLLFEQVKQPNPFLYTALIRGYSLHGPFTESISLYTRMRREGTGLVTFTFSAIIKACIASLDLGLGRQIHAQTISIGGFTSDLYISNTLIDMYVKGGFLDCGRQMFDEMTERDVISWTSLIVAYTKCGNVEAAAELFDGLPVKDMVAWTSMVTGFAQNARPREAFEYFEKMQDYGVETDEITLVGVISACAQLGATKYAKWIREIAEKSGLGPSKNVVIGSALIDMYSKCGSIEDAYEVFQGMKDRNVFSYSSMIVGFAMHGFAKSAIQLFNEMLKTDIKPNGVTFIGVLTACSHGGMVEKGRRIFSTMEEFYGVAPVADHYACMVDLLGRSALLEEALDLIRTMPMAPHGGVWGALLGACRIHGNPDIAEIAASHLFELEPNGIGNYILLSNIYASSGKWDDVSQVRKLMRMKGLKKNPSFSWIEGAKGVIHEFFAGDMSHPKTIEIKKILEDLLDKLKLNGYTPNLNSVPYDVVDEEKKRILLTHSEKLALAYGLLSTDSGFPIKIVKNIRICEDCHSFMCGASLIAKREIVVRDNMRFHHFLDGICSCGNFW